MSLSDYLKKRSLSLEPLPIGEKRKLTDEQLSKVSQLDEEALITLIQPRIDSISDEMLQHSIPEEVPVLRQALVEIGGLIDDLRAYRMELERRKLESEQRKEETDTPQPQTSPPVEEGEEGSL